MCDARPTVTFPAVGHQCPVTGIKLYCMVTEARVCEQLAQGCYLTVKRPGVEPSTSESQVGRPNHYTSGPHHVDVHNMTGVGVETRFVWFL